MQGEDDLRGLAKIMAFMRAVSIILVLMHFYWFCYGFFIERGWTLEVINKILGNFNRTAGIFSHTLYTKLFAIVILALSCLGTKGVKNEKITWPKIYVALITGGVLYFLNTPPFKTIIKHCYHLLHSNNSFRIYRTNESRLMDDQASSHESYGRRFQ